MDVKGNIRKMLGLRNDIKILGYNLTCGDGVVETLQCKVEYTFPLKTMGGGTKEPKSSSYLVKVDKKKLSEAMNSSWKRRKKAEKKSQNKGQYNSKEMWDRVFTTSDYDYLSMRYFIRSWRRMKALTEQEETWLRSFSQRPETWNELAQDIKQDFVNFFVGTRYRIKVNGINPVNSYCEIPVEEPFVKVN